MKTRRIELSDGNHVELLEEIDVRFDGADFERLWEMHPEEQGEVLVFGRRSAMPRWQQAYGRDYPFSGQVAEALPMPDFLEPALDWAREHVEPRLNGVLLNWYDGSLGHYIGQHHDTEPQLVPGVPIVTMSFGEERVFRLTREAKVDGKKKIVDRHDEIVGDRSALVIPWETNLAWKHGVPKRASYQGRRVSITIRAFQREA